MTPAVVVVEEEEENMGVVMGQAQQMEQEGQGVLKATEAAMAEAT